MRKYVTLLLIFNLYFTYSITAYANGGTSPSTISGFTDIVPTNSPSTPGAPNSSNGNLTVDLNLEDSFGSINDLNNSLDNMDDFFNRAGSALDNLNEVFGKIDGILDGSIFKKILESAIGDFSLFGLDPIPSVGVAAALGMVAIPVAANLINKAIEGLLKLVNVALQALWKLITYGFHKKKEYLKAFKEAKKEWLKLKKLGSELDIRIIQSIKLYYTIQKIKQNSNYVMDHGYRLAIESLIFNLEGVQRRINRQLDDALDNALAEDAQKLSQVGAKVSLLIEDAKNVKKDFPKDLEEDKLCKKLKADYSAILMVEGELQKARGHILGARDYWQQEWNKENKKIDRKFKRVKMKSKKFYRNSISMAKKGKRTALKRLKKEKNKISVEEYAEKEALILETYNRTIEKAHKDREVELQKAKRLYLDFNAQFGEYEGYTRWFSDLINTQISLTKRFSALMNVEDQIENICVLVGSEYY